MKAGLGEENDKLVWSSQKFVDCTQYYSQEAVGSKDLRLRKTIQTELLGRSMERWLLVETKAKTLEMFSS